MIDEEVPKSGTRIKSHRSRLGQARQAGRGASSRVMESLDGPTTRAEWADYKLRWAILAGELQPGERLVTEALAAKWELSPTPLREAYQRLAGEGLVELTPQRGARVARVSTTEVLEIYRMRLLLEPLALRLSLQNASDDWKASLIRARQHLAKLEADPESEPADQESAHWAFHDTLLSECKSEWLLKVIRMLWTHSVRYRMLSIASRGGRQSVVREHDRLMENAVSLDAEQAAAHLIDHIKLTVDSVTEPTELILSDALVGDLAAASHLASRNWDGDVRNSGVTSGALEP